MVPIVGAKDLLLGQWLVEQCFGCSELFRSVKIPIRCWHFSIHVPMFHERVFVGPATMCGCAQSKRTKARKRTKQSVTPTTTANCIEPTTTKQPQPNKHLPLFVGSSRFVGFQHSFLHFTAQSSTSWQFVRFRHQSPLGFVS